MREWIICGLVVYGLTYASYHFLPPKVKTHEFWNFSDCMMWLGISLVIWPLMLLAGLLALVAGFIEAVHQNIEDHGKK